MNCEVEIKQKRLVNRAKMLEISTINVVTLIIP